MRVIATAGHVDHGKSTLVRALTGMEPDRWAEERRRGLTIGLGYVWTDLDGERVAFVDVPGHERFVPTMLAGVGPVPAVLFVVAADGGWMPQTSEHLAVLDAFGVRHGLLAITRADLADPEPARADALERIAATSLGTVESVAVSAVTGAGLAELRAALRRLTLPDADPDADVRLWVDRVFSVSGAGTVVTGTLAAGSIAVGDKFALPAGHTAIARSVQSLGEPVEAAAAVARVAVNLRGVEAGQLARGSALLTPGAWDHTDTIDVRLTKPARLPSELVLHIGSAAVPVRVRALDPRAARLQLRSPLPLRIGDRVVLRDPGQHAIAAGADVLDLDPPPLRRSGAAARRAAALADVTDPARFLVAQHGFRHADQLRRAGLTPPSEPFVGDWHVDPDALRDRIERAAPALDAWLSEHPLRPGMPLETLAGRLDLPDVALAAPIVERAGLAVSGGLVRKEPDRALPAALTRAIDQVRAQLADDPFAAPDVERLRELGLGVAELAAAERAGFVTRVTDTVVLLPDAPDRAMAVLQALDQPFSVSAARMALGTSRRVAVPLLELLDRIGRTRRDALGNRTCVIAPE
ncbi:selenocysteine-specific translation elongation factor [Labedaea rhizosphaerae]|uniref:Selenocysteine-specific elongation factor n=1 Tax=Labedaea rhizosphaerae TaxID=598644 RepID=A0A4R6SHA1_LABRH|nr:selenocysteine-specific translation elongation factor [Labedaea rhizosphaerae]TDQ00987.1 selenocysteine-specific elongation factor [Labedaea rhizosphaerae]